MECPLQETRRLLGPRRVSSTGDTPRTAECPLQETRRPHPPHAAHSPRSPPPFRPPRPPPPQGRLIRPFSPSTLSRGGSTAPRRALGASPGRMIRPLASPHRLEGRINRPPKRLWGRFGADQPPSEAVGAPHRADDPPSRPLRRARGADHPPTDAHFGGTLAVEPRTGFENSGAREIVAAAFDSIWTDCSSDLYE